MKDLPRRSFLGALGVLGSSLIAYPAYAAPRIKSRWRSSDPWVRNNSWNH